LAVASGQPVDSIKSYEDILTLYEILEAIKAQRG